MSHHFKLEITNRSVRITVFNNVDVDFAKEYSELLGGVKDSDSDEKTTELTYEKMTPAMRTVFGYDFIGPMPASDFYKDKDSNKDAEKKKRKSGTEASDEFKGKYNVYNYNKRVKQRAAKFKTLSYINFRVPNVQFVTLTFDPKIVAGVDDLKVCHHCFQKFIKRFRRKYSDFLYIATFSRQKNGNWHYHMLCNLDVNVKNKVVEDLWTYGMTWSTPITSYGEFDAKVSYCIQNMYDVAWDDLQGENGYLACRGLQGSVVLRSWNDDESEMAYEYLSKILESTDKPLDVKSYLIGDKGIDTGARVSYKVSHKVFGELFQDVKIAKEK